MKVVLCVWIEPYIENDLSFCVWPVHAPATSKEVLTFVGINQSPALYRKQELHRQYHTVGDAEAQCLH